jgi:hypothetical protein
VKYSSSTSHRKIEADVCPSTLTMEQRAVIRFSTLKGLRTIINFIFIVTQFPSPSDNTYQMINLKCSDRHFKRKVNATKEWIRKQYQETEK